MPMASTTALTVGLLAPTRPKDDDGEAPPRVRRFCGVGPDVLLAVFVASNVAMLLGYDIGVMSGAKRVMQRDLALTTRQVETLVGSLNLVSAGGGLLSGTLADTCLGRRGTVAFACLASVIGSVVMALAPQAQGFAVLMVGRTLCGVAVGGGIMIAPLYISELSPKSLRGRLVSFFEVAINVGILLGYVAGWAFRNLPDDISWRWMMGVGGIPPAMILLCLCFMPESPRWLLARGREEEAVGVLRGICEPEEATETLKLLKIETIEAPQISVVSLSDALCNQGFAIGLSAAHLSRCDPHVQLRVAGGDARTTVPATVYPSAPISGPRQRLLPTGDGS